MTPPQKRKKWDKNAMVLAVKAVRNKEMGYKRAAKLFNVPKGTLERYVKNVSQSVEDIVSVSLGRKPVLGEELENQLVAYCIDMDQRYYGLRRGDIRRMAFQLALRNGRCGNFSLNKGIAGKKWLRAFLRRHPNLSIRSPQGISSARVKGFNPENVAKFFDIYESSFDKIQRRPHRLYNVDETGLTIVQHKHSKVISSKGKKQVAAIQSAERGALITVITCMNAVGNYVPPLIIWPRKNMKQELMDGAPSGSIYACHTSGWVQTDIFTKWFDHFIAFTKPNNEDPVLLVLDGHSSHTRNLEVIKKARENNIIIVCLPPHSTHKMQPLDVGFMGPLKTFYAQEIENWLRNHPTRSVTSLNIASLFCSAYNRAATMEVSVNAFRKTGLYPCNRNIFREQDFAIHNVETSREEVMLPANEELPSVPCEGAIPDTEKETTAHEMTGLSSQFITPADISPLPNTTKNQGRGNRGRKPGSANIITSSPYKNDLEANLLKIHKTKRKSVSKSMVLSEKSGTSKGKIAAHHKTRKTNTSSSSDVSDEEIVFLDDSLDDDSDVDANCLFCGRNYSDDKHGEQWVQCIKCYRWGHEDCGAEDANFTCPSCKEI